MTRVSREASISCSNHEVAELETLFLSRCPPPAWADNPHQASSAVAGHAVIPLCVAWRGRSFVPLGDIVLTDAPIDVHQNFAVAIAAQGPKPFNGTWYIDFHLCEYLFGNA